jgi:hypothetical protein
MSTFACETALKEGFAKKGDTIVVALTNVNDFRAILVLEAQERPAVQAAT